MQCQHTTAISGRVSSSGEDGGGGGGEASQTFCENDIIKININFYSIILRVFCTFQLSIINSNSSSFNFSGPSIEIHIA